MAEAPTAIRSKLEVRGVGIVALAPGLIATVPVRLVLVADLVDTPGAIERMPEPYDVDILGRRVCGLRLYPFEPSAVLKLRLAAAAVSL